mmetsp:Transcript_30311/g.36800  ORF Transcript_30311/g.36800 Transcript_30311/m.36800 type:complete len:229 (-) Transcript_30311:808-1494(-)
MERRLERDVLLSDTRVHTQTAWSFPGRWVGIVELKSLNSLEAFGHMSHHLHGTITIGQDIQKIGSRDEIETRECTTLALHVIRKCLLTNLQLVLLLLKILVQSSLARGLHHVLDRRCPREDALHFVIDMSEPLRGFRQLLLHLVGVNEKRLQVRPCAEDLREDLVHVVHHHQLLVPSKNQLLERLHVSVRNHTLDNNLVILQSFKVFFSQLHRVHVSVLVTVKHPHNL